MYHRAYCEQCSCMCRNKLLACTQITSQKFYCMYGLRNYVYAWRKHPLREAPATHLGYKVHRTQRTRFHRSCGAFVSAPTLHQGILAKYFTVRKGHEILHPVQLIVLSQAVLNPNLDLFHGVILIVLGVIASLSLRLSRRRRR
jgi:hypothetical protein